MMMMMIMMMMILFLFHYKGIVFNTAMLNHQTLDVVGGLTLIEPSKIGKPSANYHENTWAALTN